MTSQEILTWAQVASAALTALATIALFAVTWVLARETRRMAQSNSQPHVVATLEPSRWAINHLDLRIANTGTATAYGVELAFEPPLPRERDDPEAARPLSKMSVLRPGQAIAAYVGEFALLKDAGPYVVAVKWRRGSAGGRQEANTYAISLADYDGYGTLGASDPLVQIAQDIRHIKEDLHRSFGGSKHIAVDVHTHGDRERQRLQREEFVEQQRARTRAKRSAADGESDNGGE